MSEGNHRDVLNRVAIIGPTRDYSSATVASMSIRLSRILADKTCIPVVNPTRASAPQLFGAVFSTLFPRKELWLIAYTAPSEQRQEGISVLGQYEQELSLPCYTTGNCKTINCGTWEDQPIALVKNSDCLICLGICTGSVWEICLTKYYWEDDRRRGIFILRELETDVLPARLNKRLAVQYVTLEELEQLL